MSGSRWEMTYMSNLQDWARTLIVDRLIEIRSDDVLVKKVEELQQRRMQSQRQKGKPPLTYKRLLKKLPDGPQTLTVKPIELLHKIGRMTTPVIPDLMGLSTLGMI